MTCEEAHQVREKRTRGRIVKLTTIVTLHIFNSGAELCGNKGEKIAMVRNGSDLRRRGNVHM